MRIVHVTPHLPPDQAANAILPAQAGEWSRARGHAVRYVAHPPSQGGVAEAPAAGPVEWMPRRDTTSTLARLLRINALQRTRQAGTVLDRVAADANLLHLHSNGLLVEAAAIWARRNHVPYVLTLYGTEIWHYKTRWPVDLFARAYHGAAAVTFYSRRLMARAVDLGLGRTGLSVIYPAVPETFAPRDTGTRLAWRAALGIREPRLIVNVKRLHELAGQKFLIDAFARVRQSRQDVRLVICGTGGLRADLEAQAVALGIAVSVKQLAWPFAAFYLIQVIAQRGWREAVRRAGITAALFAAANAPFVVWDAQAGCGHARSSPDRDAGRRPADPAVHGSAADATLPATGHRRPVRGPVSTGACRPGRHHRLIHSAP